uniref:Methylthioribulose-1-phosphate dehydratase/methylthioribulose 1-phosphate dehydratase / enolase-phosphatase E1 n=1 Tax=Candidatus Kentrum sp. FW TaxID=2126338 RepID=A0A450T4F9_9GAMM|nr:MAG: methylthioribulose-1-phosphate dehydratase/methylthioribulose 1-phosphate dehydratase / enolase-phosphatase E1 [Candidatus Kentron sp. FW]
MQNHALLVRGAASLGVFLVRGTGAIIHSHGVNAVLVTMIANETFEVTHLEMMKGIAGIDYHDRLIVPIVENTAREGDLADSVARMMEKYPESHAVLVRRHGIYVWGKSWKQAKIHAECYDHLFNTVIGMRRLGIDPTETASMRN